MSQGLYNPESEKEELILWSKVMDLPYDCVEEVKEDFNDQFDKTIEPKKEEYKNYDLPDEIEQRI